MKPQHSGTERFLTGKRVPFLKGKVKHILKSNGNRVVVDEFGNRKTVTKKTLLQAFNSVLSKKQGAAMAKTIRVSKDNTATMKLGGLKKGKTKTYVSGEAARLALKRRYGK